MLDRRPKGPQPDPVCPGHPLLMMLYTPLIQSVSDVWRQHKELHEKVDWEKIFRALRDWGYTMGKNADRADDRFHPDREEKLQVWEDSREEDGLPSISY
jgi:hypothetical protein